MTVVFLIRHGRSSANTAGVLAGWTPGVHLDETGRQQAGLLGATLSAVKLSQIVSSPLERTVQTAEAIMDAQRGRQEIALDSRFGECHYGDWSGKKISQLRKRPLWSTIQAQPSAVTFPGEGGESLVAMQARAVQAVLDWNRVLGKSASYAIVSHGDVIKSILADALGMHLDMFQRITVDPGSLSIVHYSQSPPVVERINDTRMQAQTVNSRQRQQTLGGGSGASETPSGSE